MVSVIDTINLFKCTYLSSIRIAHREESSKTRIPLERKKINQKTRVTHIFVCLFSWFLFRFISLFSVFEHTHPEKIVSIMSLCFHLQAIREEEEENMWWSGGIACLWLMIIHFVSHNCRHMCAHCAGTILHGIGLWSACDIVHAPHTHTHTNHIIKIRP